MPSDRADPNMRSGRANPWVFWPVILVVVALDVVTKAMARYALPPLYTPHQIIGEWVRFTLAFNPGAAFSLYLGPYSRQIFTALTFIALFVLGRLYRETREGDYLRTSALALVSAGAIGNLLDRLRSSLGVTDFIDIGVRDHRWPTFNGADIAVTVGASLLAWVLYQEDRAAEAEAASRDQASADR